MCKTYPQRGQDRTYPIHKVVMDTLKTWHKITDIIKEEVSAANFRTWFSKTSLKEVKDKEVKISVPSTFIKEQLNSRYRELLLNASKKILGTEVEITFNIEPSKISTQEPLLQDGGVFFAEKTTPAILNPKYTLDNFVVGLSNNVAYAAAQAIIQNPGLSYNPLLVYGGTGVGKTHLMLGIGNAMLSNNPSLKVIYASSEKFTNDYVEAIQTRNMLKFRNRYRSSDLLLIDDIQFLSGREGTQEEFFHTFNELQSKNSQIILTSDRPPNEMAKLEARLQSRFQGGLMVDIQLPDFDTRVAILRAKCQERGEHLPEEVLHTIASALETNGRELEGRLMQLIQILKIQNQNITPETVSQLLGQPTLNSKLSADYRQVLAEICRYFNIKHSELTGPKRNKELVLPRHISMYILSEDLHLTVEKIGHVLGKRDHTTVLHGRDRIKKLINQDREVQRICIELKSKLAQPQ